MGAADGILVGRSVGSDVGMAEDVGVAVGELVGSDVGADEDVGVAVRPTVGCVDTGASIVGVDVGEFEGESVIPVVGLIVGLFVPLFFIPFLLIPCFIPFLLIFCFIPFFPFAPIIPFPFFFDFALASGIVLSNTPEGKIVGRKVVGTGVGAPVLPIPLPIPFPFPLPIPLPFPLPIPLISSSSVSGEVSLEMAEGKISGRTLVGASVGDPVPSAMGDILADISNVGNLFVGAGIDGVRGPTLGKVSDLWTGATGL